MKKILWRGVFNLAHSVMGPFYRSAYTKRQAWKLMCDHIAMIQDVSPSYVYAVFDGSEQNFEIESEGNNGNDRRIEAAVVSKKPRKREAKGRDQGATRGNKKTNPAKNKLVVVHQ